MEKIRLLLYCTKQPLYLVRNECDGYFYTMDKRTLNDYKNVETFNGKIVAECDFEVEEIKWLGQWYDKDVRKESCLSGLEIYKYLEEKGGYAIHIKNLHIFDKPMGLKNNIFRIKKEDKWYITPYDIKRPPQNMMRCYYEEYGTDIIHNYILISIRPEWICKILNGEKTIEIRRKVLKEMVK